MLLTCPTCRSGLQVPDGTSARVRCPTCRTIFSPAEGVAPPPTLPVPPAPVDPKPAPPVLSLDEDEDRPYRPARPRDDEYDGPRRDQRPNDDYDRLPRRRRRVEEDNRDGIEEPADQQQKRRRPPDDGLSLKERQKRRAQFQRGMWGCRLLNIAFGLQALSLLVVVLFLARNAIAGPSSALVVVAGVLGLVNWVLGAIGVSLCLASRPAPGLYRFGGAAAAAVVVHAIFLLALVGKRAEGTALLGNDLGGSVDAWGQLPTKLDSLTLYMASLTYPDERLIPRGAIALTFLTGVAEVIRLVLVMVMLSCVVRAAGDDDLAHRCIRAAGIGSFGPVGLAVLMLLMIGGMTETGAIDRTFGAIVLAVFVMGIYAILGGMLVPSMVAARDAAEACEFPFQSKRIEIGD